MAAYSKAIAAVVGGLLSWLVARFALPAEWASTDMQAAITTVATLLLVYWFPANKPQA
jgi:hypothetical protein